MQSKLDAIARLERHYITDAEAAKCHSLPALKEIPEDEKRHAAKLAEEIGMRAQAGVFN